MAGLDGSTPLVKPPRPSARYRRPTIRKVVGLEVIKQFGHGLHGELTGICNPGLPFASTMRVFEAQSPPPVVVVAHNSPHLIPLEPSLACCMGFRETLWLALKKHFKKG